MCAFFQSKNPESVHSALTWVSKSPQPAPVPRHRPPSGKEWNGTGNPIHNTVSVVTGYGGGWVFSNTGDNVGVQPVTRPNHRPPTGSQWNVKVTTIRNEGGKC